MDTIPYEILRRFADGHGFYLSTKMPIPCVLRYRLTRFITNIVEQDKMLKRDCLVHYLTQRELDWACYRRGFFPQKMLDGFTSNTDSVHMSMHREEQEKFLLEWIRCSVTIHPDNQPTELLFSIMLSETPKFNLRNNINS